MDAELLHSTLTLQTSFRDNGLYNVKDSTLATWKANWKIVAEILVFSTSRNATLAILDEYFNKLWNLYTDVETRHYHTAVHIEEMLNCLSDILNDRSVIVAIDKLRNDANRTTIVTVLAIFFHDAIYDSRASTNEEDSIKLFDEFAASIGMDVEIQNEVAKFIIATKEHEVLNENSPLALFLDLDLAVLGKEESAYMKYAALIRKEYKFVPAKVYCSKRAEILESFLMRQYIYGTTEMRNSYEMQARYNIQKEISLLKRDLIPS